MSHLNTTAMLSNLSLSCWTAKKYDKRVSKEVAEQHGTTEDAGRYNKNLRPGEKRGSANNPLCVQRYDRVVTAFADARLKHNEQTLPWSDEGGTRILLSANCMDYSQIMRGCKREIENSVDEFLPVYPDLIEFARQQRGDLFRAEDYPSPAKMAKKFEYKQRFLPIPNAYDFRANISDIQVQEIRKQIKEDEKEWITTAMKDPYERLWNTVAHMSARLQDIPCPCKSCKGTKAKSDSFKDSLVENVRDLCALIPKLNLTNDPQLEAFRVEIETGLTSFEASDLRKDPVLKKSIAERAAEIQQQMAGYCGVAA